MRVRLLSLMFDNTSQKQILLKNSFWLAAADGAGRLTKFLLTLYVIRTLGGFEYGRFAFAFAFVSLFSTLFDFGLAPLVTRELARDRREEARFAALVGLKLSIGFLVFGLIVISGFLLSPDSTVRRMILVLGLTLWFGELSATYYAFFRSHQRMEYEAWLGILGSVALGLVGATLLGMFPVIESFAFAYLVSAVVVMVGTVFVVVSRGYPIAFEMDRRVWRRYLAMAAPLAGVGVAGSIYIFSDSVMLGYFGQIEETGLYNAALKIVGLAIIPMNLVVPVFLPAMSSALSKPHDVVQSLFDRQMEIVIFIAFMITFVVFSLASGIIEVAFTSSFAVAGKVLQISIVMALFHYLWSPCHQILVVYNRQRQVFFIHLAGAAVNVLLNAILIPRFSLYGAAIASALTQFGALCLFVGAVARYTPVVWSLSRLTPTLVAAVVAAVGLCGVLLLTSPAGLLAVAVTGIGGAVGYVACFFGVRRIFVHTTLGRGLASRLLSESSAGADRAAKTEA